MEQSPQASRDITNQSHFRAISQTEGPEHSIFGETSPDFARPHPAIIEALLQLATQELQADSAVVVRYESANQFIVTHSYQLATVAAQTLFSGKRLFLPNISNNNGTSRYRTIPIPLAVATSDLLLVMDHITTTDEAVIETTLRRIAQLIGQQFDQASETASLRASSDWFRSLIETAAVGIIVRDSSGRIVFANQSATDMLGVCLNELIGQIDFPIHIVNSQNGNDSPERKRLPGLYTLQTGQPAINVVISIHRRDGTRVWLTTNSRPLYHPGATTPHAVITTCSDVTERRETLIALAESEARYRSLSASSPVGIFHMDSNGDLLYINQRGKEILGHAMDQLQGNRWATHIAPDDHARIIDTWTEAIAHGDDFSDELRFVRATGDMRWIVMRAAPLRTTQHVLTGYVGTIEDINERKQADETMRRSEERFRSLVQHSSDVITILNKDLSRQYVGHSIEHIIGYTIDEFLKLSMEDLVHPDDLAQAYQAYETVLANPGLPITTQFRGRHRDGSWRWMESITTNLLHDPAVRGLVSNTRDITERYETEVALRETNELFHSFISNSSDIIATIDKSGIIQSISPAVESVLAYKPEELIHRNNVDLVHPDDLARVSMVFGRCLQSPGLRRQVELRVRHRDGSWRCLETVVHALHNDPAVDGIMIDARDITERRTAAEALEAANVQLRLLNQAKSDFVSLVSHEFRTPLTGIRGFSELIRDEDLSLDEIKEFAEDINSDAQRLARLIDQLLDLERMQSGRMQLDLEPVDFNHLVCQVVQQFRITSSNHQIQLKLDDTLSSCMGDKDKLIQIVTNLLGNALKYSPHGGAIQLTTRFEHQSIHFAVSDQGIGIAESQHHQIFDRYARVEHGAGHFIKGIGLGLPITRQIAEMHGGEIWVESRLGEGSTFHVRLPFRPPAED